MLKRLYERIMFLICVPKCVFCTEKLDVDDRCFCKKCRSEYEEWKLRRCSRCNNILSHCSCTSMYLKSHYIKKTVKVYRYRSSDSEKPSNRIIYALKQQNRADVFDFLADELTEAIRNSISTEGKKEKFIITNVPRRPTSIRKYGYDHSKELARRVAKRLNIEYRLMLKSKAKHAQKEMLGAERLQNVSFDFKRRREIDLKGRTVILIDDIITTGASMGACAALLRALGTRNVIGASVAIAYKDMYTPFVSSYSK